METMKAYRAIQKIKRDSAWEQRMAEYYKEHDQITQTTFSIEPTN